MQNLKRSPFIVTKDEFIFGILAISYFFVALYYCWNTEETISNVNQIIYIFCVLGTIQLIISIKSIRKMQGEWFSLYLVFFLFLYIFSYGQFLMWTFGIHYANEMTVSRHVRFIDKDTVVRIQAVSLHLLSVFHLGALLATRKYKEKMACRRENHAVVGILRLLAFPMLVVSGVINVYYSIIGFEQAAISGYLALFDISMPPLIKYLSYMFVPALFLNLVTHNYAKRWFYGLTGAFLIYAIPLLITGDRGSWIYFLGPWLWCYIKFVNKGGLDPKAERRKTIFAIALVLVVLFVSSAFVSIRGEGYTTASDGLFDFEDFYTPFVKPFFEMGQSARILGIIIQDNLNQTYPFGNTYIADILGMVWPTLKVWLGFPDMYVENWMSTDYLHMVNYGVGFSSFAEAYLNGGIFFSWFYILVIGWCIGRLTTIKKEDVFNNPIKTYLALGATTILGPSVRATLDLWLREFFWGVLLVLIVANILVSIRNNKG